MKQRMMIDFLATTAVMKYDPNQAIVMPYASGTRSDNADFLFMYR